MLPSSRSHCFATLIDTLTHPLVHYCFRQSRLAWKNAATHLDFPGEYNLFSTARCCVPKLLICPDTRRCCNLRGEWHVCWLKEKDVVKSVISGNRRRIDRIGVSRSRESKWEVVNEVMARKKKRRKKKLKPMDGDIVVMKWWVYEGFV